MTYEEKLQKIVSKLKDERDLTRKGHKTKVTFDDTSFTKVRIGDISKILLKLRDDDKALTILDAYYLSDIYDRDSYKNVTDDNYDNVEIVVAQLDETFDVWYESYLMGQKTSLKNLDFINMLRIYDTIQDINEQIQLTHETKVRISLLPSIIRYKALFPADTIGLRDEYCGNRLNSLKWLKEKDVIIDYTHGRDGWDTLIMVSLVLSKFDNFYKVIQEAYVQYGKSDNKVESTDKMPTKLVNQPSWPEDFMWDGKTFVFGTLGSIEFSSEDRRRIFKALTDKKGHWATINEMKGGKDANFVRSTIKQVKDRLPEKVSKKIAIISTQDADTEDKPKVGAYKITIRP